MASLVDLVKRRFLEAIRSVNKGQWKILVIDEHAQRLIGATMKTYDILEENVTLIESINSNRKPEPNMDAMYLLMPTTQNIKRIIADFSDGRVQYGGAHIFFIDGLPDQLFQRLTSGVNQRYLKSLVDLYLNFWAIEAQAFSLYMPSTFFSLFTPPRTQIAQQVAQEQLQDDMRFMSKCILNVCVSLGEYPQIRYYRPAHHAPLGPLTLPSKAPPPPTNEGSGRWRGALSRDTKPDTFQGDHLCQLLAMMVQEELDEYKKANPEYPPQSQRPQAVMFITDRSMDTMAPFLHEFTYQAMCNDLLKIEDGVKYKYKFQSAGGVYEDKVATLSDADTVWTEIRHMHMREAIDKLMNDFNVFLQNNAGFKGEGAATLNDMKDMLANLPQYQEQREKFSLHLNMAQECMELFEKKKLPLTGNVEQNCATGVTSEGKTPKTLVEEMVPLLDEPSVSSKDKVRIIALYIMFRDGVPDEDRRRLFEHARLSRSEQEAVNSLVHLGVRIARTPADRDTKKKIKQKNGASEEEYELSRYKPLLRTVIDDHFSGRLDPSGFPYVREPAGAGGLAAASAAAVAPSTTSLRKNKATWHKAGGRTNVAQETKQRVIVFVAGGMTYSEMRSMYQIRDKDVYIGSTHCITPENFIDDLKDLERGMSKGGASSGESFKSFQAYYDDRYYIKDAPPPPRPAPAAGGGAMPPRPGMNAPVNSSPAAVPMYDGGGYGKEEKKEKKSKWKLGF